MSVKKINQCKICKASGDTHFHHIIPISLGGDDDKGNLVELCDSCHGKAHGCNFGGSSGLINNGLSKKKLNNEKFKAWVSKNEIGIIDLLTDFAIKTNSNFIADSLLNNTMSAADFYEVLHNGKAVSRKKYFGDTAFELHKFFILNASSYSIDNATADSRKGQKRISVNIEDL